MLRFFSSNSPFKNRAKLAALGWTLLIFILCFIPGNELPRVNIPLIDKWAHIVLFGVFALLWLCAVPTRHPVCLFIILAITIFVGWLVEYVQGHYVQGRSQDDMDTFADSVGGVVGIIVFYVLSLIADKKYSNR